MCTTIFLYLYPSLMPLPGESLLHFPIFLTELAKIDQNLKVSSAPAETTVVPSGF